MAAEGPGQLALVILRCEVAGRLAIVYAVNDTCAVRSVFVLVLGIR